MLKIKMLKTTAGALDGISIRKFEKGLLYEVPVQISDYLAKLFLKMEVAEIAAVPRKRNPAPSETAVIDPPEIKVEPEPEPVEKPKVIMRVFQLADELNMSSKDLIKLAKENGIHAPAPQSGLSEVEVNKIKESLT